MTLDPVDFIPLPSPAMNGKCDGDAVQEEIRGICAKVLGRSIARVKANKSFLSQGGDSLLAIKLMVLCREAGYGITIKDILQSANIADLCLCAERCEAPSTPAHSDAANSNGNGASGNGTNGNHTNGNGVSGNGANGNGVVEASLKTPLNATQRLHLSSRATRVKIFRFGRPIETTEIFDALRELCNRHPILSAKHSHAAENDHELRLETEERQSPILETCELEQALEVSQAELTEATGTLVERIPDLAFGAMAFTRRGTPAAYHLGIAASRAIMDAPSWDTLADQLDVILSKTQTSSRPQPAEISHSWTQRELRAISGRKLAADGQSFTAQDDETLLRDSEHEIDLRTNDLLYDGAIHAVLRTEPRDFVTAAAYLALQSTSASDSSRVHFRTVDNGSFGSGSKEPSKIGCFESHSTSIIESNSGEGSDIDLVRRIRDARLGYREKSSDGYNSPPAQPLVTLDVTCLQRGKNSSRNTLEDVCRAEFRRKPRSTLPLEALPQNLTLSPFWVDGRLKFGVDSGSTGSSHDLADAFRSALTGLLHRFQNYESHASLVDFPHLNLSYEDVDALMTDLKRVTSEPLKTVESVFPCSLTQEVFLVAQGINNEMYQCSGVAEIRSTDPASSLDYSRLTEAWRRIVREQAALRTVFIDSVNRPGHYDQVVLKEGIGALEVLEDEEGHSASIELSSRRPVAFDNYGATHRATICSHTASSAIMRLDISHALVDGASMDTLFKDISRAYLEESSGAPVMPYSDFVTYQRGLSPETSISYWTGYLTGANPSFFPTNGDHLRHEDLRSVPFRANVCPETIVRFCEAARVTPANLCQVAWALVLRSYTGSDDVCFSYVSSGRQAPLSGISQTVGVFVDTMICRVKMDSESTMAQVLDKAQSDFLEGMSYPSVFMAGHETQGREFSRLRGNTIMSCQRKMTGELVQGSGLSFELLDAVNPSEYDLTLNILTSENGLEGTIDFWHPRIDQQTAESVSESFQKALINILNQNMEPGDIDIVPETHISQIRKWNNRIPPKRETRIHDGVLQQRLRQPDAPAVDAWDGSLTYQQLDDEANKLASYLSSLGVGPEVKIPLCFEKSKWAIVSQLAVLKAGGCVVPFATKQPTKRTEIILKDIEAYIVLTTHDLSSQFEDKVRHVTVIDEKAVKPGVVKQWINHVVVFNAYGPSECSMQCSINQLTPECNALNIGFAFAGALWVAEATNYNRLVPIGAPGELLVQGPLQARGYLNDETKTAAAFITNPVWASKYGFGTPMRLYRTGDLVQQNRDGSITYIGRRDTQIKFRGQRVETAEIEHHLIQHESVIDAAVLCPTKGPCKDRLVGLVSLGDFVLDKTAPSDVMPVSAEDRSKATLQTREIGQHLRAHVPEHMVPTVWVPLSGMMPQNASAKLDRKKLGQWVDDMDQDLFNALAAHVVSQGQVQSRPATAVEDDIRNIWAEVLSIPVDQIPLDYGSFMSLGGDSISAMKVASCARAQGISLAVRDLLQARPIAQLAENASSSRKPLGEVETDDVPFPLSPAQKWYFEVLGSSDEVPRCGGEHRYNQSSYLALRKAFLGDDVARAMKLLVSKHAMLRARFSHDRLTGVKQHIVGAVDGSYGFEVSNVSSHEEAKAIIKTTQKGLDLEHGPVFSARLFQLRVDGTVKQSLFMAAHHLVVDTPSWRIILRDLEAFLQSHPAGSSKTLSFRAWTNAQAEAMRAREAEVVGADEIENPLGKSTANLDYWGLEAEGNLYRDMVAEEVVLDDRDTALLFGAAAHSLRVEPAEVFLSTLLHSFRQAFPDRAVPIVYDQDHGRGSLGPGVDASDTVGCFLSMLPLHNLTRDNDGPVDVLKRVKDARRLIRRRDPLYSHSQFPTSHSQAEILFNYIDRPQKMEQEGGGLFNLEGLSEPGISPIGDAVRRRSIFGVQVSALDHTVKINFQFNGRMKRQDRVWVWIDSYATVLRDLLAELVVLPPMLTLSDFPLASMSATGLTRLQDEIFPKAGVKPEDIEDFYPCSPIQQGILMSQAREPSKYQIQYSFEIQNVNTEEKISADSVLQAWQILTNRHPMLRTVFVPPISGEDHGSTYHQMVLRSWKADVTSRRCDEDELESLLAVQTISEFGMDSYRPNHMLQVYSTPSGRVYARLVISHALGDATSLGLLMKELLEAYRGNFSPESKGPLYSPYVEYLQQTPTSESLTYWSTRLADAQPCYMPSLTDVGMNQTADGGLEKGPPRAMQVVTSQVEGLENVQKLGETLGVTVANVFQLAWAMVLSEYTGSRDISFGYLASGRDVPVEGVNGMIGPLINMMITRIKVDADTTVHHALRQVQDDFLDGFGHQRAPLVDIWHALELKGQSLFNTSLSYRHNPDWNEGEAGLALHHITSEDPTEYDANVNVVVSSSSIAVSLQYLPEFLSPKAATRVLETLLQAVQSLALSRDSTHVGEAPILTRQDVEQLIQWNNEVPRTNGRDSIHDLVHRQALLQPDAPAVCAWDGDLSYGELEGLADQLAHHLVSDLGVVLETKVALCFDKSRMAIISQLAVLKAGGVVVSVNPKHPAQRLQGILRDINADVVLTTSQHSEKFIGIVSNIVEVDADLLSRLPMAHVNTIVQPENAAVIIYTSGSTGMPKGVVLTHLSLLSSFQAHGKVYGMSSSTRSLQFATYTFDASISDIFGTLYHGGCVCVISEDDRMNNLQGAMQSYNITSAQLTPTVASLLDLSQLPRLETLVLGGEAVKTGMVNELIKTPRVRSLNGYGPSECSIYATCGEPLQAPRQASIIGRPLAGGVWVVGDGGGICPIGAVGELWIGGPLLAREYLNDRSKTEKSFVKGPPWARDIGLQDQRFYRTGDLVRQSADGYLLYIGRRDMQVKIRGQRVEVGEIEHKAKECLGTTKTVVATLVTPRADAANPIVALVVELDDSLATDSQTLAPSPAGHMFLPISPRLRRIFSQLRSTLLGTLPSYMTPGLYVPVTELPMTASGKVDRRLLSLSLNGLSEQHLSHYSLSNAEKVRPVTVTEKTLQSLWAAVLGVEPERIGTHDHFFHSGGDSFTAMRLVSMSSSPNWNISLHVSAVFNNPRLVDMARFVDSQKSGDSLANDNPEPFTLWKEVVNEQTQELDEVSLAEHLAQVAAQCQLAVDDIEDVYPCSPLQEGLMAITSQRPRAYVGRWVYRISEQVDVDRFKDSWSKLHDMTSILRTRLVPGQSSGALQVVVRQKMEWLLAPDLDRYLEEDSNKSMAYGSPLARHAIVGTAPDELYFVFTAHHAVYDGHSLSKMYEAVSGLYAHEDIPPLVPYTRFIKYLQGHVSVAAKPFWKSQLDGDNGARFPALPGASSRYRPQQPLQTIKTRLDIRQGEGSVTMPSLLRAAWALAVSAYRGNDVVFAVPLSGRGAPVQGVMDIMAPTITTVPVRIQIDETQSVGEFLSAVHQQTIDMMPFEHTGLQHIRRLVGRDVQPQHMFAIQPVKELEDHFVTGPLKLEANVLPMEGFDDFALNVECITGLGDQSTIDIEARFDESVLTAPYLGRLLGRFKRIFTQLSDINSGYGPNAALPVGAIDMASPEEIAQLAKWNGDIPERLQVLVHGLIARHVLSGPDEPAVCAWDGNLSRVELDRLSERLARHLINLGAGPEVMVPLCLDKSKWAVVSMLATLKAGSAMVPVKADPVLRLQAILRDTGAKIVLTTPHYASSFEGKVPHIVSVDEALFAELPDFTAPVDQTISPSNAALVIYTSGSTGTPKGVVSEHGAFSTGLQAHGKIFGMSPATRAFQFAQFTFDASLHDVLTTLQFGGCVCMPSEEERMSDLAGSIRRLKANYMFLTPRVLSTLKPFDIPAVRTIILGGEAVLAEHTDAWVRRARVFDAYGPAECSIMSTAGEIVQVGQTPRIGHAIAGALWVVNEDNVNELVPIGTAGELLLEGPLLARGYLNDKEKTAGAFIYDPAWSAHPGLSTDGGPRRMYRTGDMVIQNNDGSLSYIGRSDNQVKIRGQRVEIGEMEHHITKHPAVADGIVLYPRQGPSKSRLVTLLTLRDYQSSGDGDGLEVLPVGKEQLAEALKQAGLVRQRLSEAVPEYMVPTAWIPLGFLPRNTSDKVDRKKLQQWLEAIDADYFESFTSGAVDEVSDTTPANDFEQRLQEVLGEILNLPLSKISLSRSFLNIGGDSITAMQVVSRCRTRHGISILVRDLLQSTSMVQLAQKATFENTNSQAVDSMNTWFDLSPIQLLYFESMAASSQHEGGQDRFNQNVYLVPQRLIDAEEITVALEGLVSRHPMLRARFHETEDGWKQKMLSEVDGSFRFDIHHVENQQEVEAVISSAQCQLHITDGPVFSADLINVASTETQVLFLVAHHLVIDLVSWRIIIRDLEDLIRHPSSELANSATSFQGWTRLLAKHAEELVSPSHALPFPTPMADWGYWGLGSNANVWGDRVSEDFVLENQGQLLFKAGEALRAEPIELLLAALFHSFNQVFPDRPSPTIFNEGHGREPWDDAIQLSDIVGWFTTMAPLHVASESNDLIDVLRRTKDLRRSVPERGLAYFASRFLSDSGRDAFGSHSRAEVLFNFGGRYHQGSKETDSLFRIDNSHNQPHLSGVGDSVKRLAVFDVETSVWDDGLKISFGFNKNMHKQGAVRRWAHAYKSSIKELFAHLSDLPLTLTLADFPSLNMTYDELSQLQDRILPQAGISNVSDMEDMYPCSAIQQGILMSQIRDPATYHVHQICEFGAVGTTHVDLNRLEAAWKAVVSRHSIMRTIFIQSPSAGHVFCQVVRKHWDPEVIRIYCEDADDVVPTLSRIGLPDYASGEPQHQLALCSTKKGQTYARVTFNHALMDASSIGVIFRDLIHGYDGHLSEVPSPSYGTYVSFLQRISATEALDYWTSRLSSAHPCYLPPSTSPATKERSLRTIKMDINDLNSIHHFRDQYGVTVANIVQLAWGVVLARYTGSKDILFGYLANGRDAPIDGINEMAGPMINMTVSRLNFSDKALTISGAAQQVQNNFLDSFNYQRTPLADIQHALHLSGQSLFNTTVSYTRQPMEGMEPTAGLTVQGISGEDPTEYDLNLNVMCNDSTMRLSLQYSASFLDDESAKCLQGSLQHALLAIASNGDSLLVNELTSMSPKDIQQLTQWNISVPPALPGYVHESIFEQRASRPNAQAVCAWDGQLTYSELDSLASRMASRLVHLGVGPESMVGLCFEKSMWAIVSMLAVLKSGGVIVPLGYQLPSRRLSFLLDDTGASVVLTSESCAVNFKDLSVPHVLRVNHDFFKGLPQEASVPRPNLTPDSAAVVIYTSGSTGRPKGVVLTQGGLFTSLDRHGAKLGLCTDSRALQFSAYVFDVSLMDTLGVLQFGGCTCVVSEEDRMDVKQLSASMERMRVNFACLTPTVAGLINPKDVPSLQTLGLAGEAVPPAAIETWGAHVDVFNSYGPAECTVLASIDGPITDRNRSLNIGTPQAGLAWVVDQHDHHSLVPIGAAGELLLEGPNVARGYLGDPERTADAFVKDPGFISKYNLGSGANRRMYRTGDMVRQSPTDGSLTFLGRRDGQVKVRGQRVEVGEIEYCVKRSLPAAQMVAADLIMPRGDEPLLAVAIELSSDSKDASSPILSLTESLRGAFLELQAVLTEELPSFMVPAVYVPLHQMPLTDSGKINKRVLRELLEGISEDQMLEFGLAEKTEASSERLTPTELLLQQIWAAALRSAKHIGSNTHFFRSGGDSVTAMRLVALARDSSPPIPLNVADIFKNPVLGNMAKAVDEKLAERPTAPDASTTVSDTAPFALWPGPAKPEQDDLERLALQCGASADNIEDAYPCTPLQEGLLSITSRQEGAYIGRWAFRLDESINAGRFKEAWQKAFDMAPILRTRIVQDHVLGSLQVPLREAMDWLEVSSDMKSYMQQDTAKAMGLGTSLSRFALVSTGSNERFFVWTCHHSVYDGWSIRKLLQAVSDIYSARAIPRLAPFTRFVQHLQQSSNSESAAKEYWSSQLKGELGVGFPLTPQKHHPGVYQTHIRSITLPDTQDALSFTTATLLRATWGLVLAAEAGSQDVVFATPLSGRTASVEGILDVMGPTITTVPVRIHLDRKQKLVEYLSMVQQQAIDMLPFEHVGLQKILQLVPDSTLDLQHLFVVQPSSERGEHADSNFPGLTPMPMEHSETQSHGYPLILECGTGPAADSKSIEMLARFDQSILTTERIDNLLEQFEHVLLQIHRVAATNVDATKDRLVGDVNVVSPRDSRQLSRWNQPCPSQPDICLHDLVRKQAMLRPEAPAVCAWDGELSYSQLDDLSGRLAHHLVALGVGPETAVALMLEKSQWAVVAQLATLKAGGIVVSIDSKHPEQRIRTILETTAANIILTSQATDRYQDVVTRTLLVNQQLLSRLPNKEHPACETVRSTNAAFIIFTSGSTGVPKGVVLEHGSIYSCFQDLGPVFAKPGARVLQFAAYTFDASIAETFATLSLGGCVCVISEHDRLNNLSRAMRSYGVTGAVLTPTVAALIKVHEVPSLKTLIFIGEILKSEVLEGWVGGQVTLYNGYGPTECSIITSLAGPITDVDQSTNIGTALGSSNLWVVDQSDYHRLVPVGSVGELLVEGPLLGRGYLNNEQKTIESFVTDPAWVQQFDRGTKPPSRFYRTGDLVRQMPDGSVVCLGRRDTQLKIRGQRVEIGEIEYWIKKKLPDVAEVAVSLIAPNDVDSMVLAAALELQAKQSNSDTIPALLPLSPSEKESFTDLRSALESILPGYMVPQLYLPVTKLPLTDSGKLNRRGIQTLLENESSVLSRYELGGGSKVAPSTVMERQLQQLWAAVLNVSAPSIGAKDNFFGSGGDSIAAMRLVSQARQRAGLSFTVADVFKNPILSDLAVIAERAISSGKSAPLVTYKPFRALSTTAIQTLSSLLWTQAIITDAAPTTDFQELCVVATLQPSRDMLAHVTLDGSGPCDVQHWRESCWQLLKSHDILRTAYVYHNQRLLQVVLKDHKPDIQHYETNQTIDKFTKTLIAQDMYRPVRLGYPFTQFAIITSTSDSRHRILFRLSHGEYDAISLSYFMTTLQSIYSGQSVEDHPTPCAYMHSLSTSQNKDESLDYWSTLLEGSSMPSFRAPSLGLSWRPPQLVHHATHKVRITKGLPDGITMSTIVRAAWARTVAVHIGTHDVVFGEVVSGRITNDGNAERTAGCCASLIPVRAKLSDSWTVLDLLRHLQEQSISRMAHETVGFREVLQSVAGTTPATLFTSIINCLDQAPGGALKFGEAEYDMTLSLPDGAGNPSDISVTAVSYPDHVDIAIGYLDQNISPELAEKLSRSLEWTVDEFTNGTMEMSLASLLATAEAGDDQEGKTPSRCDVS
ncbi:NRPS [Amphichorda felina]